MSEERWLKALERKLANLEVVTLCPQCKVIYLFLLEGDPCPMCGRELETKTLPKPVAYRLAERGYCFRHKRWVRRRDRCDDWEPGLGMLAYERDCKYYVYDPALRTGYCTKHNEEVHSWAWACCMDFEWKEKHKRCGTCAHGSWRYERQG